MTDPLPAIITEHLDEAMHDEGETTVKTAPKPWWKSRTILLQILGILVSVIAVFAASPTFQPYAEAFAIVQSVLTIILRVITTQPISGGSQ